ncbi:MAG: group II intron reverse transcriptase domain-containing protein [Deltaproteobacteria bacterium]|nr:group II intron reverse transcriptase domain-containing protein [Deltaproteobacteria bacterium]
MFTYQQLYGCYLKCRKNKRNTINQLAFEIDAERNLLRLEQELNNRTYRPARSVCFVVDRPKLREIFAADFRDRVIHHVLVDHLEPRAEPKFIFDSYACRKNRGTHAAVKRLQGFTRSVTRNNSRRAYCLQLDVRSFFVSINKDILFDRVKKYTDDPDMIWLAEIIIFNDCTQNCKMTRGKDLLQYVPKHKTLFKQDKSRGLPIGNLTSQFFANVYLNELDQFVKHTLKCRNYMRYSDDALILHEDKEQLERWKTEIETFLKTQLGLDLNERKTTINPVGNGIDYLGYIVRPFYILVRRRVINNLKHKIRAGRLTRESLMSYLGHFKHANAYKLKQNIKMKLKGGSQ